MISRQRHADNSNIDTVKMAWRRPNHRMMGPGKAEDAMVAPGTIGRTGR